MTWNSLIVGEIWLSYGGHLFVRMGKDYGIKLRTSFLFRTSDCQLNYDRTIAYVPGPML